MDSTVLQNLRYKLQSRIRRVETAEHIYFDAVFRPFWSWLEAQSLFAGIMNRLLDEHPDVDENLAKALNNRRVHADDIFTDDEEYNTALCICICKQAANPTEDSSPRQIATGFAREISRKSNFDELLDVFRRLVLDQVYEYLDEALDDERAILGILRRYKKKCEWFNRETLHSRWHGNTRHGEEFLANHLYEYLHDQGLNFRIEERTASGRPDLVSLHEYTEGLVADAKVFHPGKSKTPKYISKGFRQLYEYVSDHNQDAGYLVVFNTSESKLSFNLDFVEFDTPFLIHNGKVLYAIEIDIYPYEDPASKRGELRRYEVNKEDIVEQLVEETPA